MKNTGIQSYQTGETVEVNKSKLKSIIKKAESVLGFDRKKRQFKIIYFSSEIGKLIGGAFSSKERRFHLPRQQRESAIFHEAVHYLIFEEEVLLGQQVLKLNLYDLLLEETIAEFATSYVYGYTDFSKNIISIYEKLKAGDFSEIKRGIAGLPEEFLDPSIEEIISKMSFSQLDIVQRQRIIEDKYLKESFDGIENDVCSLYDFCDNLPPEKRLILFREAIRMLAISNAVTLNEKKHKPEDLVASLKDGVSKGWDLYGLYFYDVVGRF